MLRRIALVGALLVPLTAAAQPAAAPAPGMPDSAAVLEARFLESNAFQNLGPATFVGSPSLFVGYRLFGRLQAGLGFTLHRMASSGFVDQPDQTTWTLNPSVAFDALRSADRQVALYVRGALPVGAYVVSLPGLEADRHYIAGFEAGVGFRYAPHPMLAFGLETGIFGLYSDLNDTQRMGVTSVYGALVGTFYYDIVAHLRRR